MVEKKEGILKLASGFVFDYKNMFGKSMLTRRDVTNMGKKIAAAHKAIEEMRETGNVKGHLSKDGTPEKVYFTKLPYIKDGNINSFDTITKLKEFGESLRWKVDTVVSFGIGGSYLGNKVIFDVQCGEFWNAKHRQWRNGYPRLYFSGNNMDPKRTTDMIARIFVEAEEKATRGPQEKYQLTLVVISKSGGTLDTMSEFMCLYDIFSQRPDLINISVVAVTDLRTDEHETILHKMAVEHKWPMFSVPDGVGGRFSIFSEVGLVTAACVGFDIEAFLAGAKTMDVACQSADVWENPALLNAALKFIAAEKYGRDIEVLMPYSDYLKSTSEWYIQLLAESLGKQYDREGKEVFYGRTPIVAVGTTDMHAQTQQHQEGKQNKVVQFIQVGYWEDDIVIPNAFPEVPSLSAIADLNLSAALNAALESNAEALVGSGRPNANFILPEVNAFHLGELLFLLALSVAYEGEFANVDAFDQPGVEGYKRILGPKMKKLKGKG